MNYKRVERLYCGEYLAVLRRERKRLAVRRVPKVPVLAPNDEWGIDFVSDTVASGRRFRCFTVVDVCTHECLALVAAHSLPSVATIEALEHVIGQRGAPLRFSLDNGSEFRSRAFDAWTADTHIELRFIQPGKPIQNADIKRFNGHLRDACLNSLWFLTLLDARFHLERLQHGSSLTRLLAAHPRRIAEAFALHPRAPVCVRLEKSQGDRQGLDVCLAREIFCERGLR